MKRTDFPLSGTGRAKLVAQIVLFASLPPLMAYLGYIADVPPDRTTFARIGLPVAIVALVILLRDCIRLLKHRGVGLIIDGEDLDVIFPRPFKTRLSDIENLSIENSRIEVSTTRGNHTIRVKNYADATEVYCILNKARTSAMG